MTTTMMTTKSQALRVPSLRGSACALAVACLLAGCATGPDANPRDPFEPYNRGMTRFNDKVDDVLLRPVATAYTEVTPRLVRTGVSNFFANLGDLWSFVNNALQLRGEGALNSIARFSANTVFGIGGLFDVATEMRIERSKQDFGLTLGRWGVPTGPYLVLPFLGPSTVRDTVALPVDAKGNLITYVDPVSDRNALYALSAVNTRANLLRASSVLDSAALDKYSFTRDAYLQVRSQAVQTDRRSEERYDQDAGKLPEEPKP
ncbi:ABC transporter [Paracidovorax avenae]|uniref:MlaA family lipoprotein n=1 Tax=Paracidovorax avenae TaxID=80867 RepID=UPI000D2098F0|nr:VacJ family lipoprotein [Paracidovorax avenae]AVS92053.1 ABC transporter [Paracidovorax avenae]AVS98159.1 ABC transporter [Paracidovorax avenae]